MSATPPPTGSPQPGAPMHEGSVYGGPTYLAAEPPRRSFALAVVALVLGALAFVFGFIPLVNVVAFFLAVASFVCGLISLIRKMGGKAMAILGVIFSVIAVITAIIVNVVVAAIVGSASTAISKSLETYSAQASAPHSIQYKVTTNGAATLHYWTPEGSSQADISTSWSKDFTSTGFASASLTVTASDYQNKSASVSCEIIIDGTSVAKNTGSGSAAMASCIATTK